MKKDSDILNKIGRKSGFQVPENYFEQFNSRMIEQLPERVLPQPEAITLWQRLRPYIYMAAMFAGIYLMVSIFVGEDTKTDDVLMAETNAEGEEYLVEDYLMSSIDEYTIFETLYADSN